MKRIIAALVSAVLALSMAACSNKEPGKESSDTTQSESASSAQESDNQVIVSDGSSYPELEECLKAQLKAGADKDLEAFKEAFNAPLMFEVFSALAEHDGEEIDAGDLTQERLDEMVDEAFNNLCTSMESGFDGELAELTVQTDSEPTAGCRLFSASFQTSGKQCYATVYEKDGRWGAIIETEDIMMYYLHESLQFAANTNAKLIGRSAERAIEDHGAIPDGEYTFDVSSLTTVAEPKNSLEATKSAVAKAFTFDSTADEGEMFLLVKNGKVYAQWRSLANPDIVGEYPSHEDNEDFTAVWGSPAE